MILLIFSTRCRAAEFKRMTDLRPKREEIKKIRPPVYLFVFVVLGQTSRPGKLRPFICHVIGRIAIIGIIVKPPVERLLRGNALFIIFVIYLMIAGEVGNEIHLDDSIFRPVLRPAQNMTNLYLPVAHRL